MSEGCSYLIGEIAAKSGLSPRTIRYYEEIGLLVGIRRVRVGGKRVYTDDDVRRLNFLSRLKVLGLSLAEMVAIGKIYQKGKNNHDVIPEILRLFDERVAQIEGRIAELSALKEEIRAYQGRLGAKLSNEEATPRHRAAIRGGKR